MFLGIDISKDNFDVALLQPVPRLQPVPTKDIPAAKPRHKVFPNTPAGFERLHEWLGEHTVHACTVHACTVHACNVHACTVHACTVHACTVHACLEATGTYGDALARFLHAHGYTVSVVNPAQIKAFGQTGLSRTKTDKADAILIACFCRMHQPPAWNPPSPEAALLQALLRRLESLRQMRQMEHNRLAVSPAPVRASIEAVMTVLTEQITATEQAIRDHIQGSEDLRGQRDLLVSIPGIADTTAAVILAELLDVRQFAGARQVAAFAGLVPRLRQSGSSVRGRSSLSKSGNSRLRRALYLPAVSSLRWNPAIQALRARMTAAGKAKMVIVGAAMRKLLQLAFGVLKSGKPFDPSYACPTPRKNPLNPAVAT
jgi:transposase